MKVADLIRFMAGPIGGWPEGDLAQRARRLRETRMLPSGGHGINAPTIAPEHAATLVIGVACCKVGADVVPSVATYATMRPVGAEHGLDFLGCQSFAETLELILSSPEAAGRIARVIVYRSWPQTDVIWIGADGAENVQSYRPETAPRTGFGFGMFEAVTIQASFLSQLALDLSQTATDLDSQAGWAADRGAE